MNPAENQPTCGRCGVYRHLHPTRRCEKPRLSFWWDRHFLWRHIAGRAWLALSDRHRLSIVTWLHARRPHLCWCEFVYAALLDDKRDDFRGQYNCACDIPLPTSVGIPRYGWCYCVPSEVTP